MIYEVFLNDWRDVPGNESNESTGGAQRGETKGAIQLLVVIIGITGNILALVKLYKSRTSRNSCYKMMLRCLIANNLIILLGFAPLIIMKHCLPDYLFQKYGHNRSYCAVWVIFRFFGISSGCIAVIMSIDNYMAMCHPFYHREHNARITKIKAIICLELVAAVITFLPFIGVGSYFDEKHGRCLRSSSNGESFEFGYKIDTILNIIFGTLICVVIVTCNTFVIKVLIFKSRRNSSDISCSSSQPNPTVASTHKIKFAKIMAFLSLSFVINWMPQTISTIIRFEKNSLPEDYWFYTLADVLVFLHFTLDPYVYVLSASEG